MLDYARQRTAAEGVTNVTFLQADAQIHPFEPAPSTSPSAAPGRCSSATARRLHQHRTTLAPRGRLAMVTWQVARPTSGSARSPAPSPRAGTADPAARCAGTVLAVGPGPCARSCPPAPVHRHRLDAVEARCGSADTPRTPTGSCSVSWAGCSKASTRPAGTSAIDDLRATIAAHATPEGVVFGPRPGSSAPHDDDHRRRGRPGQLQRGRHRSRRDALIAALDEQAPSRRSSACVPPRSRCSTSSGTVASSTSVAAPETSPGRRRARRPGRTRRGHRRERHDAGRGARRDRRTTVPARVPLRRHQPARLRRRRVRCRVFASASSSTSAAGAGHGRAACASPDPGPRRRHRHRLGMHAVHGADPDLTEACSTPGGTTPPTGCPVAGCRRCSPTPVFEIRPSSRRP